MHGTNDYMTFLFSLVSSIAFPIPPYLFIEKKSDVLFLLVYVDDIVLTGNSATLLKDFILRLHREFAMKDLGKHSYFLSLELTYTHDGLFLSQGKYAQDILDRFDMSNYKPFATPLALGDSLIREGSPFPDATKYCSLLGSLQYLTITRPDLSFDVNHLSQFLQTPTEAHYQAVKMILLCIKDTRRSTYGYSIFLGGNLISLSARKKPTVARSSCESEYRAMATTASEIIWVTHLLHEISIRLPSPPVLFCNNNSAVFLSQNPVADHKRAKHINITYTIILSANLLLRESFILAMFRLVSNLQIFSRRACLVHNLLS